MRFEALFQHALGNRAQPFPFQKEFAEAAALPSLVNVPTGLGKTAMLIIGWLWRRFCMDEACRRNTPRRLIYCLPMRVLVEQTRDNARQWVTRLHEQGLLAESVPVHILMGGEDEDDWDIHPQREAIIIGTQDMLLSRALNRGYAASRARWPMQFGLLHTDCLWVFDEIQLMGSGLATTAQLEAFRHQLGSADGHGCQSVWMSATMQPDWLKTVDFKDQVDKLPRLKFNYQKEVASPDIDPKAKKVLEDRWTASKPLQKAGAAIGDPAALAGKVVEAHKPGTRTIVVVNTVNRAHKLHEQIRSQWGSGENQLLILLHSRFRPPDRQSCIEAALADPPSGGTIIVSTQVIEAGVDVSAATLFTELAPWASLVQRFGRCNRRGEQNETASVQWIDLPTKTADAEKARFPYELTDLRAAAEQLEKLTDADVGLGSLPNIELPFEHTHVIRKRDLIDLFDTTPDLAGNDIDIDRYVREVEDSDVRAFWRAWERPKGHEPPPDDKAWCRPMRDELCSVPVGSKSNPGFRQFAKKLKGSVWRWDFIEGKWARVDDESAIYPGQTYLVHTSTGGYDPDTGWTGDKGTVEPIGPVEPKELTDDAYDDEGLSKTDHWQTIAEHTDEVCKELDDILASLPLNNDEAAALRTAARWHDWGKAHDIFQAVLPDGAPRADELWAKASGTWKRYRDVRRPHFRHELASALALLQRPHAELSDQKLTDDDLNLVAYLIAAHHGKVRLSIRSLPNETQPPAANGQTRRFARGVWDDDKLPPNVQLGGDVTAPAVTLWLEPMELGLCEQPPFAGQPSWVERVIRLRDTFGPFRLAYLETLLRAADWRASARDTASSVPIEEVKV